MLVWKLIFKWSPWGEFSYSRSYCNIPLWRIIRCHTIPALCGVYWNSTLCAFIHPYARTSVHGHVDVYVHVCLCLHAYICAETKFKEGMEEWVTPPPPTVNFCHFAGQKRQYNVFLRGTSLDTGSFNQLLLLIKRSQKNFCRASLWHSPLQKIYWSQVSAYICVCVSLCLCVLVMFLNLVGVSIRVLIYLQSKQMFTSCFAIFHSMNAQLTFFRMMWLLISKLKPFSFKVFLFQSQ